ncbi:hypothetical protein AYK24_08565 [Thermoplasmatales archaeon SG8-52-4]|nr:MAG: hypothetical protein AYK24_08565 [Thermoplasmatales archaeon SG8-52-4]
MKNIISWLNESNYIKPLSPACKMCADGSKLVLLITGLCPSKCFYCPLSKKKIGKDRIFADEMELKDEKDTKKLILEAELINATGAGITGGDPLVVWKRTKNYISILKDYFGSDFHIHLYTTGIKNGEHIDSLVSAGLDEIRFHPPPNNWAYMNNSLTLNSINNSLNSNVDVAIEIPAIPGMQKEILSLTKWANDIGIKWINLNELEFSETNAEKLKNKGFTVKDDISAAVEGSQKIANDIIDKVSKEDLKVGLHYCSSSFKDGIQLRNRIKRRANNISKKYDVISSEGTLLRGIILSKNLSLKGIYKILKDDYKIDEEYISINIKKKRIEIAVWILEKIAIDLKKQGFQCFLIEEYPTADALEVERIPMPL